MLQPSKKIGVTNVARIIPQTWFCESLELCFHRRPICSIIPPFCWRLLHLHPLSFCHSVHCILHMYRLQSFVVLPDFIRTPVFSPCCIHRITLSYTIFNLTPHCIHSFHLLSPILQARVATRFRVFFRIIVIASVIHQL